MRRKPGPLDDFGGAKELANYRLSIANVKETTEQMETARQVVALVEAYLKEQ